MEPLVDRLHIIQIPKMQKVTPNKIIGIIDASGSMESCWQWLVKFWNEFIPVDNAVTITFDHEVHYCESNRLTPTLSNHGGGGTNIPNAFQKLELELEKTPKDTPITVIFISDGQDSNLSTLGTRLKTLKGNQSQHALNFICLGVGSGFPTFLSMELRQRYHLGEETLPAIFLIEYASEKAFLNKFSSIKPYFSTCKLRKIQPSVMRLPWRENVNEVYENSWVLTEAQKIELDGETIDISRSENTFDGVYEIFRAWAQTIHLDSLKADDDIRDRALKTLVAMDDIVEATKQEKGIDVLKIQELKLKDGATFYERVFYNYLRRKVSRAAWFYEDIKKLSKGNSTKNQSEFDAAKRIGIGTIVGKYQQKAFALKEFTVEEFLRVKEEFETLYSSVKFKENLTLDSFQTQKDIFMQKDFEKGMKLIENQFDLIEAAPLVGIPIRVKRYEGAKQNPWLTDIRFISEVKQNVESVALLKRTSSVNPDGGEGISEGTNAVLPIFDSSDCDIKSLLSSKLYEFLLSYNLTDNLDSIVNDSYLILLANALCYTLNLADSEWRTRMLENIYNSAKLMLSEEKSFKEYQNNLLQDAVATIELDDKNEIGLSKAMLHLFFISKDKLAPEQQVQKILLTIIQKFVLTALKERPSAIESFVKLSLESVIGDVLKRIRDSFPKFKTKGDFRRKITQELEQLVEREENYMHLIEWDVSILTRVEGKVTFRQIQNLAKILLGRPPNKNDYIKFVVYAAVLGNLKECLTSKRKVEFEELKKEFYQKIDLRHQVNKARTAIDSKKLEKEFQQYFKEVHSCILPISAHELREYCKNNNKNFREYQFMRDSNLLRNACMAPKCRFYLVPDPHLSHHLAIWGKFLPFAFHKTVDDYCDKSEEEILQRFKEGQCTKDHKFVFRPEDYDTTIEETLHYISVLKEAYKKIKSSPWQ